MSLLLMGAQQALLFTLLATNQALFGQASTGAASSAAGAPATAQFDGFCGEYDTADLDQHNACMDLAADDAEYTTVVYDSEVMLYDYVNFRELLREVLRANAASSHSEGLRVSLAYYLLKRIEYGDLAAADKELLDTWQSDTLVDRWCTQVCDDEMVVGHGDPAGNDLLRITESIRMRGCMARCKRFKGQNNKPMTWWRRLIRIYNPAACNAGAYLREQQPHPAVRLDDGHFEYGSDDWTLAERVAVMRQHTKQWSDCYVPEYDYDDYSDLDQTFCQAKLRADLGWPDEVWDVLPELLSRDTLDAPLLAKAAAFQWSSYHLDFGDDDGDNPFAELIVQPESSQSPCASCVATTLRAAAQLASEAYDDIPTFQAASANASSTGSLWATAVQYLLWPTTLQELVVSWVGILGLLGLVSFGTRWGWQWMYNRSPDQTKAARPAAHRTGTTQPDRPAGGKQGKQKKGQAKRKNKPATRQATTQPPAESVRPNATRQQLSSNAVGGAAARHASALPPNKHAASKPDEGMGSEMSQAAISEEEDLDLHDRANVRTTDVPSSTNGHAAPGSASPDAHRSSLDRDLQPLDAPEISQIAAREHSSHDLGAASSPAVSVTQSVDMPPPADLSHTPDSMLPPAQDLQTVLNKPATQKPFEAAPSAAAASAASTLVEHLTSEEAVLSTTAAKEAALPKRPQPRAPYNPLSLTAMQQPAPLVSNPAEAVGQLQRQPDASMPTTTISQPDATNTPLLAELPTALKSIGPSSASVEVQSAARPSEGLECVSCWEAPVEVAIAPCGHRALCKNCFLALPKDPDGRVRCPMCRRPVESYIERFWDV